MAYEWVKKARSWQIRDGAVFLLILAVIFVGCVTGKEAVDSGNDADRGLKISSPKQLTDIGVVEGPMMDRVHISGNQSLAYTSVKQPFPPAVLLYFTNTRLDPNRPADLYQIDPPRGKIVRSINAIEVQEQEGEPKTTRVEIRLARETPYQITREGTDVIVSFADSALSEDGQGKTEPTLSYAAQTATRLQSIYATALEERLKVFIGADGAITNYKTFTIDSPPRIVFDIFNVDSPYDAEKQVSVNTHWVEKIRYFGYPDRLRLVLETDSQYLSSFSAYPVDNGLMINVGAGESYAGDGQRPETAAGNGGAAFPGVPSAGRLQSIYATQLDDSTMVTVRGNGTVHDYEISTMSAPPTIVVDLYGLQNPYEPENAFPVDTRWIERVRHETFPDKVRMYIETKPQFLNQFSVYPDKNGLIVYVGRGDGMDAQGPVIAQPKKGPGTGMPVPAESLAAEKSVTLPREGGEPSWVNRIDFLSEDAGKSTLIVGTTAPVSYEIDAVGDRQLQLKLYETQTPDYRQRPLITNRFESAVDKIVPRQEKIGRENVSIFTIDLRESVPYFVEQKDGILTVNFEASSISPIPPADSDVVIAEADAESTPPPPPADPPSQAESTPSPQEPLTFEAPAPESAPSSRPTPPVFDAPPEAFPDDDFLPDELAAGDALPDVTGPTYTGEPIALDFFETDIKNVFRILREVSGMNFAVDNDVTGKVTLTLEHPVPWDQVLDLVLKMNQLGKTMEGNIIRIATRQTLNEEEQERQERLIAERSVQEQEKALEPLITEYIPVNYSDAGSEIRPHLDKIVTKDRGTLSVDQRTNMVIITDTASTIDKAKEIVEMLDRVTPQVLIEARIVEANVNFSKSFGTDWNMSGGLTNDTEASGAIADQGVGPQRGYNVLGGTYGWDMAMNLPLASAGTLGFNFTRIAGTPFILNAMLMAMESRSEGRIVSAPRVLTLDNKPAQISQGFEYPYQTRDEDGQTEIAFKNVDLTLDVTPHITPDNRISMRVVINKNDIFRETADGPALTTKSASTELLVNDGDTFVIGGIIRENETIENEGIPGLSKIPILGWFFKSRTNATTKQELLIFITPKIVQLEQRRSQL